MGIESGSGSGGQELTPGGVDRPEDPLVSAEARPGDAREDRSKPVLCGYSLLSHLARELGTVNVLDLVAISEEALVPEQGAAVVRTPLDHAHARQLRERHASELRGLYADVWERVVSSPLTAEEAAEGGFWVGYHNAQPIACGGLRVLETRPGGGRHLGHLPERWHAVELMPSS